MHIKYQDAPKWYADKKCETECLEQYCCNNFAKFATVTHTTICHMLALHKKRNLCKRDPISSLNLGHCKINWPKFIVGSVLEEKAFFIMHSVRLSQRSPFLHFFVFYSTQKLKCENYPSGAIYKSGNLTMAFHL